MRIIDANDVITAILYDEEHEETYNLKMTIADFLDSHTEEGCPQGIGWISVKDRMPENETIVVALVQYEVGWYHMLAWHDKRGWHSSAEEFQESDGDYVTHWMPLPEPPKEGDS